MAWNKPTADELAKELFGETAEEVKKRLAKLDSIETALTAQTAASAKQTELIETLSNTIKDLKVSSPYDSDKSNQNRGGDQSGNNQNTKIDWSDDADGAFNQRIAPIIGATLETRADFAQERAQAKFPDWKLFEEEINALAKTSPLAQKVHVIFWENCYFVCKGKHHDEIVRDQNMKSGKFFTEVAGNAVVIRGDENKKPEDKLSDAEKEMAKNLGVPLEIYAKNKESMRIQ